MKTIFVVDLVHRNLCGKLMFPSEYKQLQHCSVSSDALDVTEMDSIYSQPLRAKGLDLVAGITCSGVNPEKFRGVAAKYERYFNQVCETAAQKEETGLPNTEEASVNSVMQAALRELGLKM